jgi:hypothetical protein
VALLEKRAVDSKVLFFDVIVVTSAGIVLLYFIATHLDPFLSL